MQYYEDTLTDNLRNIYDTSTVSDYIIQELSQAIRTVPSHCLIVP